VEGLSTYFQKFSKRLNSGNRIYIQQLLASLNALDAFLGAAKAKVAKATAPGTAVNQNAIFDGTSADVVNFHKLRRYVDESKLAFKVDTYLEKSAEAEALGDSCGSNSKCSTTTVPSRPSRNVLGKVISFLVAITNPSNEGKLVFGRSPSMELQLEYILLDPSHAFRDVVEQARCVVLAGGTMQPVSDYTTYLFPYLDKTNIKLFSAGHVIPDENVKLLRIAAGPANQRFLFTFGNRENRSMTEDLGRTLINIARHTPQGLVIFFPSYQLLNKISATWRSSGLWDDLNSSKEIFQEPKSASDVDQVLTAYSKRIAEVPTGATLLSVVGGKMSEGINFSDGLARSVVMIGLPFPNLFSAEMIAKRQYVEQSVLTGGGSKSDATEVARDYYENVCMRAVNQSIGRAIRHASDYASIVLIDERYQSDRICNKLPTWLGASIMPRMLCGGLDMTQELDNFFLAKS
jgi:chromosome transmission fidelity protein 1